MCWACRKEAGVFRQECEVRLGSNNLQALPSVLQGPPRVPGPRSSRPLHACGCHSEGEPPSVKATGPRSG